MVISIDHASNIKSKQILSQRMTLIYNLNFLTETFIIFQSVNLWINVFSIFMCHPISWIKPCWTQFSPWPQLISFQWKILEQTFRLITPPMNTETFTRCSKFAFSGSPNNPPHIPWPDWHPFSSLPMIWEGWIDCRWRWYASWLS